MSMAQAARRQGATRPVLLRLLRSLPDDTVAFSQALRTYAARPHGVDWISLVEFASYHGVLSALDWRLVPDVDIPRAARVAAQQRLTVQHVWHGHLLAGLRTAADALGNAGVAVCAVKGPVLAERLYSIPESRHCLDIDFLVAPDDFDKATIALTSVGYHTRDAATVEYMRRYSHHLEFSGAGLPPIELHFRTYAGFGAELPASLLLDRAAPFAVSDSVSVLVPSAEDEFVYLSVHAAGHSFIRLVWLYDLKMLLRRSPALDWKRVHSTAERFGVVGPVAYATRLLQLWLGVDLDNLPAPLQQRNMRARMADWLLDEVSTPQPKSMRDNFGGLLFTSLLCDRLVSGGWLLQHHVLRSARRRLHQMAPTMLPARWSV